MNAPAEGEGERRDVQVNCEQARAAARTGTGSSSSGVAAAGLIAAAPRVHRVMHVDSGFVCLSYNRQFAIFVF